MFEGRQLWSFRDWFLAFLLLCSCTIDYFGYGGKATAFIIQKEFMISPTWVTSGSYMTKLSIDSVKWREGNSTESKRIDPLFVRRKKIPPYNVPEDPDERWEFFYKYLLEFYLQHGHTHIPVGAKVNQSLLRNWIAEQRRAYMRVLGILEGKNLLPMDRRIRLHQAGFDWNPFGGILEDHIKRERELIEDIQKQSPPHYESEGDDEYESKWVSKFQELVEFYLNNGHSHIPANHPKLGRWVWAQRRTPTLQIPPNRKKALEAVNFHFIPTPRIKWTQFLSHLERFQKQHGHCEVPYDRHPLLAEWVKRQRQAYRYYQAGKKSPINEARILALNKIDFEWNLDNNVIKEELRE